MEKIISAAIHYDDGKTYPHQPINISYGYVMTGRRHYSIVALHHALTGKLTPGKERGFITTSNRFVSRKEAFTIALNANQVLDISNVRGGQLYSEDIY